MEERRKENWILFLLGLIAFLLAAVVAELGAIDWALFAGFEIVQ